jgi:hypothetical protein
MRTTLTDKNGFWSNESIFYMQSGKVIKLKVEDDNEYHILVVEKERMLQPYNQQQQQQKEKNEQEYTFYCENDLLFFIKSQN